MQVYRHKNDKYQENDTKCNVNILTSGRRKEKNENLILSMFRVATEIEV